MVAEAGLLGVEAVGGDIGDCEIGPSCHDVVKDGVAHRETRHPIRGTEACKDVLDAGPRARDDWPLLAP